MKREGELLTIGGRPTLRFERRYPQPIDRVWRAISEPSEMAQWFPSNVEGDRAVGADLVFDDDAQRAAAREAGEPTRDDGPMFRGTVVVYDPPKVFSFTWGGELLRFELVPDGTDTLLTFTHVLSHQSVAARNGAGWHWCLGQLDEILTAGVGHEQDGLAVYHEYVARIGPALGAPTGDGAVSWERATHVEPDRVRHATTDAGELDAWGGSKSAGDRARWDIQRIGETTLYRLTVNDIRDDAEQAAMWHARLVQLDMYLAAGQLVPVDHQQWIPAYAAVL